MVRRWLYSGTLIVAVAGSAAYAEAQAPVQTGGSTAGTTTAAPATPKATTKTSHTTKGTKKKQVVEEPPPPPPPPPTPEQSPAGSPVVSYQQGQLTIRSENSTLSSILDAVQKDLGASVDAPGTTASDRIATQIGPGDPRDVLSTLLTNSKYDFILLGKPDSPTSVQKIILTARAAGAPSNAAVPAAAQHPQQSFQTQGQIQEEPDQEAPDSETPDDANQPEQPPPPTNEGPEQGGAESPNGPPPGGEQNPNQPKTPEQLLQELQRMQQQQQQQQQQQPQNQETPDQR